MSGPDRHDVVIIGAGPNGLGLAAYLAKAGLDVCVLEERLETGGAVENVEPRAGFRIDPHATYLYGAAAPIFDQLNLGRFGFRMRYLKTLAGTVTSEGEAILAGRFNVENTVKSLRQYSDADANLAELLYEQLLPHIEGLLRSIFWTPPYTEDMVSDPMDLPWMRYIDENIPLLFDLVDPELAMKGSTYEICDQLYDYEPMTVMAGQGAWYNGPYPGWRGVGLLGMATGFLMLHSSGCPVGGMHTLIHSVLRCALHHGATVHTNSPVDEIIVEGGQAKGVVLGEESAYPGKRIMADKAVVSGIDVQQTFLDLLDEKHISKSLLQKIKDINLHGGSLFVLSLITKELPRYRGDAEELFFENGNYPSVVVVPGDSREIVKKQAQQVFSHRTHPTDEDSMLIMVCTHDIYDETRCPEGYHVLSPIYLQVPPPEYHRDGPEAVNRNKEDIADRMINLLRKYAPNMTEDVIVDRFINTPYDSEFRNTGLVGGNWYAIREDEDQWYSNRPVEELSRYRTPVDNLYLCNQTSYPGGLCLFAVPYNLMHILMDDGLLEEPDWWYSSPWHRPDDGN